MDRIIHPTGPAEMLLPCDDLPACLAFFVDRLGFRVETIFPAEDPTVASLSGYGLRIRLEPGDGDPGVIRLGYVVAGAIQDQVLTAPNGTRIALVDADQAIAIPPLIPSFIITRGDEGPAEGAGRAGMIYRDLIPGRLGGRFIASRIALPEGGPVADWVHFHKIRFQMIFCRRGWARVVYEDQGPPFLMAPGDCVLQPPRIRHRVLETSAGFEVVEIGCPALHETLADHEMDLPTGRRLPERDYGGQTFLHHVAAQSPWRAFGGFERRDTGMDAATGGLADAYVLRPGRGDRLDVAAHHGELLFGFLLDGSAVMERAGDHTLGPADAFVIPPGDAWALREVTPDFRLLQVAVSAS